MKHALSGSLIFPLLLLVGCAGGNGDDTQDTQDTQDTDTGSTEGFETERILLHEMFTGSNCGPCLDADEKLLSVLHENPGEYNLISYQIGSDPYLTYEGVQRRMYYLPPESGSYSIPYLHVDGVHELHPHLAHDEEGYLQEDFDSFQGPTHLRMEVSHTLDGQTVDIEGSYEAGGDYPSLDLRLFIAIVEKTTYNNVGSNGQTEFHHVMKKMLPDQNGESIEAIALGELVVFEASYTFNGEYDSETGISNPLDHATAHTVEEFEDLEVLVWIQDFETRQIYQSAVSD